MYGIKIQDTRKTPAGGAVLNFDLSDILAVIGEPARKARWRSSDFWCLATVNSEPWSIRETRRDFTGEEFIDFASSIYQTVDGRFEIRREGAAKKSWLIIKAVDSSWFEVWCSKADVIERLRDRFQNVSDLTESRLG